MWIANWGSKEFWPPSATGARGKQGPWDGAAGRSRLGGRGHGTTYSPGLGSGGIRSMRCSFRKRWKTGQRRVHEEGSETNPGGLAWPG